jgi:hypothetical protein
LRQLMIHWQPSLFLPSSNQLTNRGYILWESNSTL